MVHNIVVPEEIINGYKTAKGNWKKLREWQKDNGIKIAELIKDDKGKTNFWQIAKKIGCSYDALATAISEAGFFDRLPDPAKKLLSRRKKTTKEPALPQAPIQQFGPEFWRLLIKTGKTDDIIIKALTSHFNQMADLRGENAQIKEKNARLIEENARLAKENAQIVKENARLAKERDECRTGWKRAEERCNEIKEELKNHRAVVRQRDRLLLQASAKALVVGGEKSLNDGA